MKLKRIITIIIFISNLSVAQFIPGTYNGSADSRDFNELQGNVNIRIHLTDTRIDTVKIIKFDHDIYHKIYGPLAIKAKKTIPREVITKQSVTVDGITGATVSSNSILLGIARAVEKGMKGKFIDGTFTGTAIGRKDAHHSGNIKIRIIIRDSRISSIEIDSLDQATSHIRWGYYVERAIKKIPESVINSQSLEIDAISQATNTSNAILLAIARALENALK